jgi:integrase
VGSKRRGQNEGTVYWLEERQRWCASVSLGYEGGKRRRKYVYGRTAEEVQRRKNALLHDLDKGLPLANDRITTASYLDRWLEDVVKPNLRPSTYASYVERIRTHIAPDLGRIPLARLRAQDIQRFLNRKLAGGRLKPVSVGYLHRILRSALTQAVKWGLVTRNEATLVDAPRVERVERNILDLDEARAFLAAVKGDRLEALYTVAFAIGLRRGEALGLQWSDCDLTSGTVTIRHELQRIDGTLQLMEYAKSRSSRRVITLPGQTLEALREHRRRQLEERLQAGPLWNGGADSDYVFTTGNGTPLDGRNVLRYFQNALKRAGLPHQRFHDTRHACASLLLAQGVPDYVVMGILGHSSISVTKNIYAHVYPTAQRDAAERMNAALFGEKGVSGATG